MFVIGRRQAPMKDALIGGKARVNGAGVSPGVGTSSKSRAALGDKATSSTVDPGVWYPVLSKEAGASPSNQATNP